MEPFTSKDLINKDALEIKSAVSNFCQFRRVEKVYLKISPVGRSPTSRAATKRQTRAVGATIMWTPRKEELD